MFIARISRGRTVREFVIGVLFVPSAFTFLWMTVFGNTAISLDLGPAAGAIADAVQANLSTALFKFLEYLPAAGFTSTLAILLVSVFFITSADSGALVIDTLASGGAEDTPRWQRMYWCILLGLTATLLLLAGGLGALQTATLLAALPFTFIMLLIAFGLVRQTKADLEGVSLSDEAPAISERLKRLFVPASKADEVDGSRSRHLSAKMGLLSCNPRRSHPPWRLARSASIWPRTFFRFTVSARPERSSFARRCGDRRCCRSSRSCRRALSAPKPAGRRITGRAN
jgi:choline-glycine betaine transporter